MQKRSSLLAALCVIFSGYSGLAQMSPPDVQQAEEDIVTLSPFEVSSAAPARYQAAESAAGGRIAANIMDTPTTVTVLTSEFIQDVGGSRVLDAAKYVAGVGEARIPVSWESTSVRGFVTSGRIVDGFRTVDNSNYDYAGIDRVEVVKGPDSLLQPSGLPGGTVNLVTKRPQFTYGGSVKLQVGEYDTNRVAVDVTGPLNDSFAYRAVMGVQDSEGYIDGAKRQSFLISPSLTWRIAPQANLTVRTEYYNFKSANIVGMPTDQSVGTRTPYKVWQGVPRTFNPTYGFDDEFNRVEFNQTTLLFTSTITDRLSVRLAGRVGQSLTDESNFRLRLNYETPVPDGWTGVNPLTGEWEPGRLFDPNSPYASIAAPAISPIFDLSGVVFGYNRRTRDLQNDWSYIVEERGVKSTTLIGFAYGFLHQNMTFAPRAAPSINSLTQTRPTGAPIISPVNSSQRLEESRYQVYLTEQLELFDKRVVLSGGVSHVTFNAYSGDKMAPAMPPPNPTVAGQMFPGSGSKSTYNYGIVVKPTKQISLYYGHTENAVPVADFAQVGAGLAPTFSAGEQDEFGIKGSFFDGRVIASIAYYEISQSGFELFNPENFSNPPPPVQLPSIYVSREADGWEFQVTGSITPGLSVIGSYTDSTNRDPNGNMLVGPAEKMASAYVRYEVQTGRAKGFATAVGVTYSGERVIDNVVGFTTASTPGNLIPIRPTGYLPTHTLVDVTFSYARANWNYSLTVANALDEDYIAAADARDLINPGTPRTVYGSVTWKF